MNAAMSARLSKQRNPELYCAVRDCLWLVVTNKGPNPCRKHPAPKPVTRDRCQKCGDFKDRVGDGTCLTFEPDSGNPFGKIPIYGVHEWKAE